MFFSSIFRKNFIILHQIILNMKKALFLIAILAVLFTSCKKDKSKSLNYTDSNPIHVELLGNHQIGVSSEYDITYKAINEDPDVEVITVSGSGNIHGFNVGTAKVKMSNGYNEKTVDVCVDLFREPSYEFGCAPKRIRDIFGKPTNSSANDSILVYQYANKTPQGFYSAACFQMLFFFKYMEYVEADLYIRNDYVYPLLDNYLDENFEYFFTIPNYYYDNNITNDSVDAIIYKAKFDENIRCGKFEHSNEYDDVCLFYYYHEPETGKNDLDKSLNNLPRSSKFLY